MPRGCRTRKDQARRPINKLILLDRLAVVNTFVRPSPGRGAAGQRLIRHGFVFRGPTRLGPTAGTARGGRLGVGSDPIASVASSNGRWFWIPCATGFASALPDGPRRRHRPTRVRPTSRSHWQSQWQCVCKCARSGRCKSSPSRRSPACSRPKLRRREAGWGASGGERPVRNASELDSAETGGEPAAKRRSPNRRESAVRGAEG
jgi:hypothetical protein